MPIFVGRLAGHLPGSQLLLWSCWDAGLGAAPGLEPQSLAPLVVTQW